MTFSAHETELALPLPITQAARRVAQEFASQQPTQQKAEQVRLNTLAVWVVNDYLQMMGIRTDITAGGSWNRGVRLCADVADLEVVGAGRLECRPIKSFEEVYQIPPEVWLDRIGYVVVQIDVVNWEAKVLGYTPEISDNFSVQPPEALVAHLNRLLQPAVPTLIARTGANLSQWLQGIVDTGWQTVEALFDSAELTPAFRWRNADGIVTAARDVPGKSVRRARVIDLGMLLNGQPLALFVGAIAGSEETTILLQVHPTGKRIHLPPQLQLMVLDEAGTAVLEAQSRSADNCIQLQLTGKPGERFSVKVALEDASITEDFVI